MSTNFFHYTPQPAASDPDALRRTAWFRDAKYGMLITWGLYSLPAGEWNGKAYPGLGEWLMHDARIPVAVYAKLAAQFNPVRFHAEDWVLLAQRSGMKYMVAMPKHHDGFALFHSRVTPFNIVDATPFQRDPMAELAAACRKHGMPLGFYYSQSQDWHHAGGAASGGSWDPEQDGDFDEYLDRIALPQVQELLTNYGPVALIWFDTPIHMTVERAARFVELVRRLQPECLINGRLDEGRRGYDYASMRDNQVLETGMRCAWETPATINDTWGYRKDDQNWKPADTLIYRLVDIVSKGGNYLLNVGPTEQGEIPAPSVDRLSRVGDWLKANGEAIYKAAPTPFGAELAASASLDSKFVYRKPTGWRCTTKPGRLYFHLFGGQSGAFRISGMKGTITRADLLANSEVSLSVFQDHGEATIMVPEEAKGELANVIRLTCE